LLAEIWSAKLTERDHSTDLGVDGDNVNLTLKEINCGGVDWIHLAEEKCMCRAFVNTFMNFGFHKMQGIA
jgi:hypothetical protein